MKDLSDMTVSELEALLTKLKGDLGEAEEEKMYTLGQTGFHLPAKKVKQYEAEVSFYKNRIEAVESALASKKSG